MDSNNNNRDKKCCKCKKSKCLKLYCECFASGLYCKDSCSCQDCYNSPYYERTVDVTRQQIKSRNPIAFSPRIQCYSVEHGNQITVVGKPVKGCKCVKSMCLKKYCDCYKANVGCSGECRCEGCCNIYGKREGYNLYDKAIHHIVEKETESVGTKFPLHEFHNPRNLTSWTPFRQSVHENDTATTEFHNPLNLTSLTSFGHSGHEKNPSTTGRYVPSLGSANFDMISLNHQSFPGAEFHNPHSSTPWTPFGHSGHDSNTITTGRYFMSSESLNHAMMVGTSRCSSDKVSLDQQSYPNVEHFQTVEI